MVHCTVMFVFLALHASGPTAAATICNDSVPSDCKKARYIGEEKGCACYECNPDTKNAKIICTKDPETKKIMTDKVNGTPLSQAPTFSQP